MEELPEPIAFQWDKDNSFKSLQRHNVTTQEAEEVFFGKTLVCVEDTDHSTLNEQRFIGLGQTERRRKLFVAFTVRQRRIRIISARDMTKHEGRVYEQHEENS